MPVSPLWFGDLTAAEVEALGRCDQLDPRPDVLVVGGGIVGLACAVLLQQVGVQRVTVVERGNLAAGASGGATGWLAPDLHRWTDPPSFVKLGHESHSLYRRLNGTWDGALGVVPMDLLLLGQNRPTDIGSDILIMSAEEISTQEPGLVTLGDGVLLRDQDRVQPLKLAAALANRVGVIATKTELLEIVVEHGRVTRALTSRGQVSPGAVLFATGSPPAVLAPWIRLDHEQVKGHLIATEPVPFRLRFALKNGGLSLTQLTDGTLLFGGTVDEGDISECVRPSVVRHLIGQLHRLAPSAIDARVIHSWCCFRPAVQDRQPVVDKVPEVENSWITFGHFRTGLLMAPIVGASLAKWILKGEVDNLIKPFQLRVPRM